MSKEGSKIDVLFVEEISRFDFPEEYIRHLEAVRSGEFAVSPLVKPEGWDSFTPDEREFHNLTLAIALTAEPEQEKDAARKKLLLGIRKRAAQLTRKISINLAEKVVGAAMAQKLFYGSQ